MTEAEMIESMAIREITPDRLLATKRIITAFNSGDIEGIRDIIYESTTEHVDVYFSNLTHNVFIGKSALFSLWSSLFEAFPNGIFRTSDSVINEKKQVFTSFLFFGTKIFPLLIDGMPLELLTMSSSSAIKPVQLEHQNQLQNSLFSSLSATSRNPASSLNANTSLSYNGGSSSGSVATVKVDRHRPIYTTAELLEAESIPEMVFEGRIVLHMNEHCRIRKFDFVWNRKM
jgi:hypothetical protein